jgi:putative ABC transport system ATP-binding protein
MSEAAIIDAHNVDYTLDVAGRPLSILRNVSLQVRPAEVVAIVGPSGSGKTSMLMLLAGLEKATGGNVVVNGTDLGKLNEDDLAKFRRHTLGIVFQSFHLIPSLTALDNVGMALEIADEKLSMAQVREQAAKALAAVGLQDRLDHRPSAMSGGEQQRVGLARATVANPPLLLADEPTAVVLITHDPALAAKADRVYTMTAGELIETTAAR